MTFTSDNAGRHRPQGYLHRAFEVGIVLKGLDGLLELVGGVLLLLVTPSGVSRVVRSLTQRELSEDPTNLIATYLLHSANALTGPGVLFGAAYLLVHGIVKVVLVLALLRNKLWAYPWMIGVLLAFILYQIYQIIVSPRVGLIALTVFDVAIVALTWLEYRQQRPQHPHRTAPPRTPKTTAVGSDDEESSTEAGRRHVEDRSGRTADKPDASQYDASGQPEPRIGRQELR